MRAKRAALISVRLGLVSRCLLRGLGRCSSESLISRQGKSRRTDCCTGTKANGMTTGDEHWHLRGKIVSFDEWHTKIIPDGALRKGRGSCQNRALERRRRFVTANRGPTRRDEQSVTRLLE